MILPFKLPTAAAKPIAIFLAVIAIVVTGWFSYKYLTQKQKHYVETIQELERVKIANETSIMTLSKSLEDEKKREKIRTIYIDRIIEVEKKTAKRQELIKKPAANSEELNKKFRGVMECFEKDC